MEFTYLFIGFYNNTMVVDSTFSYNIPLAYICTIIFYFILWIISIVARSVPDTCQVYFQYARVFSHFSDKTNEATFKGLAPRTHSMGRAARVAVATGGGAVGNYSMIVFTGWDYGSVDEKATKLKQKSIRYRLQVGLEKVHVEWISLRRLTTFIFFLSGGSGGGAVKGKSSRSDSLSESYFILPTGFYVHSFADIHRSGPLLHHLGYEFQPGK